MNNKVLSLLYNRLDKGMSPLPDIAISTPLMLTGNFPLIYGIPYLAMDSYDYYEWYTKALQEIEQLRQSALEGKDPCEINQPNTNIDCKDNKIKLLEEINKYED